MAISGPAWRRGERCPAVRKPSGRLLIRRPWAPTELVPSYAAQVASVCLSERTGDGRAGFDRDCPLDAEPRLEASWARLDNDRGWVSGPDLPEGLRGEVVDCTLTAMKVAMPQISLDPARQAAQSRPFIRIRNLTRQTVGSVGCTGGEARVRIDRASPPAGRTPFAPLVADRMQPERHAARRGHAPAQPKSRRFGRVRQESRMTRIATTHVGSMPRRQRTVDFIFARERGESFDAGDFAACMVEE